MTTKQDLLTWNINTCGYSIASIAGDKAAYWLESAAKCSGETAAELLSIANARKAIDILLGVDDAK
jgi:hypothetical protein